MRLLLLKGRTERRVPVGMPVYLARVSLPDRWDLAVATDACEHGIRVVTSRHWRRGETLQISSLVNQFRIQGKVAYCWRHLEHSYCTGVAVDPPAPRWWEKFLS